MSEGVSVGGAAPAAAEEPPRSPRQTRMGPAPFASFEDLSDEVRPKGDSPDEKPIIRLPDINEDETTLPSGPPDPGGQGQAPEDTQASQETQASQQSASAMENLGPNVPTSQASGNLQTPSTPRIDISRASSSSHHDSRDSSPENAIFGISSHDQEGAKLGLGFREDGTADLRSSTEELAFLEPNTATAEKESSKQQSRKSPLMFKQEDHHRKDSQCSDIVLLSISGRTSRLSSIGSQGSAHSNVSAHSNMSHLSGHSNVSHISGQSRLSVISGVSRSPSPHKMLLETSFCGPKPLENDVGVVGNDKHHTEVLEQVLLSRKHDPKEAILAEGISVGKPKEPVKTVINTKSSTTEKSNPPPVLESKEVHVKKQSQEAVRKDSLTSPIITVSTLGTSYKMDRKPNTPPSKDIAPKIKSTSTHAAKKTQQKSTKSSTSSETDYIRIKLKPDYMYEEENNQSVQKEACQQDAAQQENMQKPVSLNLNEHSKKNAQHFSQLVKNDDSLNKGCFSGETIDVQKSVVHTEKSASQPPSTTHTAKHKDKDQGSRTPSPAAKTPSRKSSFCSLFKSRETIASPESPTGSASKRKGLTGIIKDTSGSIHSSRSRSKSRERDKSGSGTPTSSGKSKGSVLAIFKPRKSSASSSPVARETLPNLDTIHSVDHKYQQEFRNVPSASQSSKIRLKYYDPPDNDGFIRIPLHTPSDEDKPVAKPSTEKNVTKVVIEKTPGKSVIERSSIKSSPREQTLLQRIRNERAAASAPGSSRSSFSQKRELKQIVLPDGSIRIPLHSPSEDRLVRCDLMTEQEIEEINRQISCNITTKKDGKSDKVSNGSVSSSTDVSKTEEKKEESTEEVVIERRESISNLEQPICKSEPQLPEPDVPVEPMCSPTVVTHARIESEEKPVDEKISSQAKKHIMFATKVGSKEQIFSTQFSLSKTDSQSSQMSENRSQISEESVIEVQVNERKNEETLEKSSSNSNIRDNSLDNINAKFERKNDEVDRNKELDTKNIIVKEICVHTEKIESQVNPAESIVSNKTSVKESPRVTRTNAFIQDSPKNSIHSTEEVVHDSSESERDSELDFIRKKQLLALEKAGIQQERVEMEPERKVLVSQQESFDDELPYIPTTLPQERSVALPIIPMKQRQGIEVKTCPIDRPRSTTPINPSCLEEYCSDEVYTPDATKSERLKICLPKDDPSNKPSVKQKAKSPRRVSATSGTKSWFEFAEQGIANIGPRKSSTGHESDSDPAPPLPPRAPIPKTQWINFENIPERRKVPKRIQTIPSRTTVEVASEANVIYTYVNPEDCKCECHEAGKDANTGEDVTPEKEEDEEPLLEDNGEVEGISAPPAVSIVRRRTEGSRDKRHVTTNETGQSHGHGRRHVQSTASRAGGHHSKEANSSSNRSSITSQDADKSSSSGSPNDVVFPPRRPPCSP